MHVFGLWEKKWSNMRKQKGSSWLADSNTEPFCCDVTGQTPAPPLCIPTVLSNKTAACDIGLYTSLYWKKFQIHHTTKDVAPKTHRMEPRHCELLDRNFVCYQKAFRGQEVEFGVKLRGKCSCHEHNWNQLAQQLRLYLNNTGTFCLCMCMCFSHLGGSN